MHATFLSRKDASDRLPAYDLELSVRGITEIGCKIVFIQLCAHAQRQLVIDIALQTCVFREDAHVIEIERITNSLRSVSGQEFEGYFNCSGRHSERAFDTLPPVNHGARRPEGRRRDMERVPGTASTWDH